MTQDPVTGKFVKDDAGKTDEGAKVGDYRQSDKGVEIYVVNDGKGEWVDTIEAAKGHMRHRDYTQKFQALKSLNQGAEVDAGARPRLGLRNRQNSQEAFSGVGPNGDKRPDNPAVGQPSAASAESTFQVVPFRAQRDEEDQEDYNLTKRHYEQQQNLLKEQHEMIAALRNERTTLTNEITNVREERKQGQLLDLLYSRYKDFDEDSCNDRFEELDPQEQNELRNRPYAEALELIHLRHVRAEKAAEKKPEPKGAETPFQEGATLKPRDMTPMNRPLTAEEKMNPGIVGKRFQDLIKSKGMPTVADIRQGKVKHGE